MFKFYFASLFNFIMVLFCTLREDILISIFSGILTIVFYWTAVKMEEEKDEKEEEKEKKKENKNV